MVICWERADFLAFRLCCLTLCRLNCLCSFTVWCLGYDVELVVSVPDHCLFISFDLVILPCLSWIKTTCQRINMNSEVDKFSFISS